jgi:Rieske Fe-S protein
MEQTKQSVMKHRYTNILLLIFILLSVYFIFVPIVRFFFPPSKIMEEGGRQLHVANMESLQIGRAKMVLFRNKPVLIIRTENSVVALSGVCPRTGCYLKWDYLSQQIICPCDYSAYDINGSLLRGPDSVPLKRYNIDIIDDKIYISEF